MKLQLSMCTLAALALAGYSHAGLVAHYTLDETSGNTAADSATADGAQDATKPGSSGGPLAWGPGVIGNAVILDGAQHLEAADAIGAGATALTLSAWINPAADSGESYHGIYATRSENWGLNIEGRFNDGNKHIDYRYDNQGGGSTGFDSPSGGILEGQWYHIALSWSTDGVDRTYNAYLNGVPLNPSVSSNVATVYQAAGQVWNIGHDPASLNRKFPGMIDDVAVYDMELNAANIAAIYAGGLAGLNAAQVGIVPEPSTVMLSLLAASGFGVVGMRRRLS